MASLDELRSTLAADAAEIIGRYPQPRSALMPLLHLVQAEVGYVSEDGIRYVAEQLGLSEAYVAAVSSFYTMYKRGPVSYTHLRSAKIASPPITAHSELVHTPTWYSPTGPRLYMV